MKRIALWNIKGGTGKTTIVQNLGHCISGYKKVVMIDCDPSGNLTRLHLMDPPAQDLIGVLMQPTVSNLKRSTIRIHDNLWLIPTNENRDTLKQYAELSMVDRPYVFDELCRILSRRFDYALFDCSPGNSRLEKCVALAMHEIITPILLEHLSVKGLVQFRQALHSINAGYRKKVIHRIVVANMVNRSFRRHRVYLDFLDQYDYEIFQIPQDAKIAEAQIHRQSILEYSNHSRSIPALRELANHIMGVKV